MLKINFHTNSLVTFNPNKKKICKLFFNTTNISIDNKLTN